MVFNVLAVISLLMLILKTILLNNNIINVRPNSHYIVRASAWATVLFFK